MEELKAEYEGYSDSIKNLMKAAKKSPDMQGKIKGTLAESISVPAEFETAIETVLGGALQNVIVDSEYDAKDVIEFLRKGSMGRVTFLPLAALKVNTLTDKEKSFLRSPGFLAVASEAVGFEKSVAPAVEFLLARTVIIDNIDNAIEIMKKADYSFRAVTLQGDIIRPGGTMTGGSVAQKQFGLLSRERDIAEIGEEMEQLQRKITGQEKQYGEYAGKTVSIQKNSADLLKKLQELEISAAEQREKVAAKQRELQTKAAEVQALGQNLAEFDGGADELKSQLQETTEELRLLSDEFASVKESSALMEEQEGTGAAVLQQIFENMNSMQIVQAEKGKEAEAVFDNIARITKELAKLESAISGRNEQLQLLSGQKEEVAGAALEIAQKIREKQAGLETLRKDLEKNDLESKKLKEILAGKRKHNMEFQLRQTSLLERKYKVEAQLEKIRLALENTGNKMWEEYSMTYSDALALHEEISYQDSAKEVQEIRGKIRELGTINPNAISDYNRVQERVTELTRQREDLTKAEHDLKEVIEELMAVMRDTFREKFEKINENFQQIFQELFGGGRAELSFAEGDIMECGIDVIAEPPGKKLQHISLLSGGEKALTAIALLFAMIRINPSPVCLLDEIDAPLDEANVVRFSNYLQQIDNTQFIVITHRKPTMSICNALYGIAMEEKGVSKLVSVRMS